MFFEATYVPSPPLSATSTDDNTIVNNIDLLNDIKSESLDAQIETDVEPSSNKPVDHVIFIIHGIGQQTEKYGHFYEHIESLQESTRQILQTKVPDHNVRIELIPIEWHRHIHDQVDPIINKITLKSIPTIRLIENDYLADVLYYFSKDRGQKIIDNITHLFNTSYHNFMEKHPNFNGKIVIMGYSLGGIITWDILSHQREITKEEESMYDKLDIKFSKLDFKPHYFFGLGSPIGAVLTFRGQDPRFYHPDFDIQFENVFHPFDPLGYRFEPLFNDYFTDKPAVLVERSIPIGPSFSFPSMPSFPLSAGFFSFFSWKQEDKAAKTIYNATAEAIPSDIQQEPPEPEIEQTTSSSGLISNFLNYFSRGGGTEQSTNRNEDQVASKDGNGIMTWDPLREQTISQLLTLRDDLDETLNNVDIKKRPPMRTRSKTYDPSSMYDDDSMFYSTSLNHKSDGSIVSNGNNNSFTTTKDDNNVKPERIALRKAKTQHLVEVLGIDGVKLDSVERAHFHFDKNKNEHNNNNNDNLILDNKNKENDNNKDDDDGNHNIWLDLDKELHKPGPAITSPGESREEIAQEATVNKDSKENKTIDSKEQEQLEINKLPRKQRMDYVLQPESVMSMIANEYLIGLRAHFSYWTNKDFIWHMLRRIENLDSNGLKLTEINHGNQSPKEDASAFNSNNSLSKFKITNGSSSSIINIDDSNIKKKKK